MSFYREHDLRGVAARTTAHRLGVLLRGMAVLVAVAVAAVARPAAAQDEPPAFAPPPTHFMGREIAQTMHYTGAPWLVRESRQREEDCRMLLQALELEKGQAVCDLGCGNGFYTLELARRVGPKGQVYAVDIQREMLQLLMQRSAEVGFRNITPVLGSATDPQPPRGGGRSRALRRRLP